MSATCRESNHPKTLAVIPSASSERLDALSDASGSWQRGHLHEPLTSAAERRTALSVLLRRKTEPWARSTTRGSVPGSRLQTVTGLPSKLVNVIPLKDSLYMCL